MEEIDSYIEERKKAFKARKSFRNNIEKSISLFHDRESYSTLLRKSKAIATITQRRLKYQSELKNDNKDHSSFTQFLAKYDIRMIDEKISDVFLS